MEYTVSAGDFTNDGVTVMDPATTKTETFDFDEKKVRLIIGRGGNKFREIQNPCQTLSISSVTRTTRTAATMCR